MNSSTVSRIPLVRRWRWQAATSVLLALVFVLSACGTGNASTGNGGATTGYTHIGNAGLLQPGVLKWGEDDTGGMPYTQGKVPGTNAQYSGYEIDIANAMAKLMGVQQQPTQITWSNWPQGLASNQFDMFMNGLEISSDNAQSATFSIPYYVYTQSIVVLKTNTTINTFSDLAGKTVETGTGYHAEDIMKQWNATHSASQQIKIVTSDNPTPFTDLQKHNVDASFIDTPIAEWYGANDPSGLFKVVGQPSNPGYYAVAFSRSNPNTPTLKKEINEAITQMWLDGTLAKIYKTGGAYNTDANGQPFLQPYGMWTPSENCIANFILINQQHNAGCPDLLAASQK